MSSSGSRRRTGGTGRSSTRSSATRKRQPKKNKEEDKPLRKLVQERLRNDVFKSTHEKSSTSWNVLVLDDVSTRVISSALGMYDLMEEHVAIVEDLYKHRAPHRDKSVIYLLSSQNQKKSVEAMINDWTDPKKILYGPNVFIYSLGKITDASVNHIKQCKPLLARVKALSELNIDFLVKEDRAFTLDMNNIFKSLYIRDAPTIEELTIAERLVTMSITLNEYPHIRYHRSSPLGKSIANLFHLKMNEFVGKNESWWYYGDSTHTTKERSTLLILDRKQDCLSPLMHEFTYQAMVQDLLPIKDDRITYHSETADPSTGSLDKDVLLNENDELWVELRSKHIADVVQILSDRIRAIVNSGTGTAIKKGGAMSLKQMGDTIKKLPQYREVMSKLSQHMHIAHNCLDIFTKQGLLDLSEIEQTLATGQDDEGKKPRLAEIVNMVEEKLQSMVDPMKKMRLLAIMIISQKGLKEADRQRLLGSSQLSRSEISNVENLEKLGYPMINTSKEKRITSFFGIGDSVSGSGTSRLDEESEYQGSRYQPLLKSIVDDVSQNKLSIDDYPSVLPLPESLTSGSASGGGGGGGGGGFLGGSGTSAKAAGRKPITAGSARRKDGDKANRRESKWKRNADTGASAMMGSTESNVKKFHGGRQLVFMVGGMCYSELRVVHEVNKKGESEIIAGSTHFIKPSDFVHDLNTLM